MVQGCAVVIEAQQLEYGRRADAVVTVARSGSFLQEHAMQVSFPLMNLFRLLPMDQAGHYRLSQLLSHCVA